MVTSLTFTEVDGKYESDEVQFGKDSVLELNFANVPMYIGVTINIFQSLSKVGWTMVYSDELKHNTTWCRTLAGVSENAYYKVVTTVQPTNAYYE